MAGQIQRNITLSDQVAADFEAIALYQGAPMGTVIRQILEAHWASPGTQELIRTAKMELQRREVDGDI